MKPIAFLYFSVSLVCAGQSVDSKRLVIVARYAEAIQQLTKEIELEPKADTFYLRATAYFRTGKFKLAVADFTEAIRRESANAENFYSRGFCYLELGDIEQSLDDFSKSVELFPSSHKWRGHVARGNSHQALKHDKEAIADFRKAVELAENNILARYHLATAYFRVGDYANSKYAYDAVIDVDPSERDAFYMRSRVSVKLGDVNQAIADIRSLLDLDSAQKGGFEKSRRFKVSEHDLAHGRDEMMKMFRDRPKMKFGDDIENAAAIDWVSRQFAGEKLGQRIYWESNLPDGDVEACHMPPINGVQASIRISPTHRTGKHIGRPRTFDELWDSFAFECHNICNVNAIEKLLGKVSRRKISEREFVLEMARLEYEATRRSRAFYVLQFVPWMEEKGADLNPAAWYLELPLTFNVWINMFDDPNGYPWSAFCPIYEQAKHDRLR